MIDFLEFPSCKLYDNGRFRLPNKVRKQLESWRIKKVVMIARKSRKIMLIPAGTWDKMKLEEKNKLPVQYPVRAQLVSGSFLVLHPELIKYLGETEILYFQLKDNYYRIWSRAVYNKANEIKDRQLRKLRQEFK
jgi:DNA-binding transcriptional regulator/RsmH inhibitor MraZ